MHLVMMLRHMGLDPASGKARRAAGLVRDYYLVILNMRDEGDVVSSAKGLKLIMPVCRLASTGPVRNSPGSTINTVFHTVKLDLNVLYKHCRIVNTSDTI